MRRCEGAFSMNVERQLLRFLFFFTLFLTFEHVWFEVFVFFEPIVCNFCHKFSINLSSDSCMSTLFTFQHPDHYWNNSSRLDKLTGR